MKLTTQTVLSLGLSLALCSCFGNSEPEPEATEIPAKKALVEGPPDELFNSAKRLYVNGLYSVARDSFESLSASQANGPYTEFAAIKVADTHFETSEFDLAATRYEEFINSHPGSSALPYVMLQLGRSQHLSNKGLGRDPTSLEKARETYLRLVQQYPDSIYARGAAVYLNDAIDRIKAYEDFVIDFYMRSNKERASEARKEQLKRRLAELAPQELDSFAEIERLAPVALGQTPPAAPQVLDAARLSTPSTLHGTVPAQETPQSEESIAIPANQNFVERVDCRDGTVYVQFENETGLPEDVSAVEPQNGVVTLKLPIEHAEPFTRDCFSKEDLALAADGTITLHSDTAVELLALSNPPRLLILKK